MKPGTGRQQEGGVRQGAQGSFPASYSHPHACEKPSGLGIGFLLFDYAMINDRRPFDHAALDQRRGLLISACSPMFQDPRLADGPPDASNDDLMPAIRATGRHC